MPEDFDPINLPSPCCGAPLVDEDEAFLICDKCGRQTTVQRIVSVPPGADEWWLGLDRGVANGPEPTAVDW